MHFIFWQNFPNHLQSATLKALAEHDVTKVTLVTEDELPAWRKKVGWEMPDFGEVQLINRPHSSEITTLIQSDPANTYHIFSGPRGTDLGWHTFQLACRNGNKIGLYAETGDWLGLKGKLRKLRGRFDVYRFEKYVSFVLTHGMLGVKWHQAVRYPKSKLFPFGYFLEKPQLNSGEIVSSPASQSSCFQIIYVGRIDNKKGVDILLSALGELRQLDWALNIIGDGPEREKYQTLALKFGLAERTRFMGAQQNQQAMETLGASDLLVLPSTGKDGWGVVVNEALMRGVPVVCSSHCGAGDLLRHTELGEVVPAGSIVALREVLKRRILNGRYTAEQQERIRRWTANIEGRVAATYIEDVIAAVNGHGPRPIPPWYSAP
jgi:glycosyltransferase involved in cell wall biosynthesis